MNARYLVLASLLFALVGVAITSRSTLTPQHGVDHVFYADFSDFMAQEAAIGDFDGDGDDDIVTTVMWEDPSTCSADVSAKINGCGVSGWTTWTATKAGEDTTKVCRFPPGELRDRQEDYWLDCGWDLTVNEECDSCVQALWFNENRGAAYIFEGGDWSGKSHDVNLATGAGSDHMVVGETGGDKIYNGFGAGDLHNDGRDELVLGADQRTSSSGQVFGPGEVYVIGGDSPSEPWPATATSTIDPPGDALVDYYFRGRDDNDAFGMGIVVGDLDGDDKEDVVVAAPYGDGPNNGVTNMGEIYVFYANDSLRSVDLATMSDADFDAPSGAASSYAQVIWGAAAGDSTGVTNVWERHQEDGGHRGNYEPTGLAIGDWNGDGFNDLAIGAGAARGADGAVYIILGAPSTDPTRKLRPGKTIRLYRSLGDASAPDVKIVGKDGSRLGAGIAFLDADGEGPAGQSAGKDDLLIGAPYADSGPSGNFRYYGEVYVVWGDTSPPADSMYVGNPSHVDVTIHGQNEDDQLGGHIAGNFDIDDDNVRDIGLAGQDVSFVIFGRDRSEWESTVDLETDLSANQGLRVLKWTSSPAPNSMTIRFLDLNEDDNDDLVFGGYDNPGYPGDASGIQHAGQMWVTRGWDMWKKGTVSANATWSGIAFVDGDITVASGVTLTISPGSHLWVWQTDATRSGVDTTRVEINVEGTLVADGTSANPIVFESWDWETQTNEDWVGFYFDSQSNGGTFDHCVIKRAEYAIESYVNLTVKNTTIEDCRYAGVVAQDGNALVQACTITDPGTWGIFLTAADATVRGTTVKSAVSAALHVQPNASVTATASSFLDSDTGVYISDTADVTLDSLCVLKHNDIGVSCYSTNSPAPLIRASVIDSNSTAGVYCDYFSHPTVDDCTIAYNPMGIYCSDNSAPLVTDCTISNSTVGIVAVDDANPDLGHMGVSGQNSVTTSSSHHVANLSVGITIMAEDSWWGTSPPKASKFSGSVDYTPYLGSAPSPVSMRPESPPEKLPTVLALGTASPNPFNPSTTIRYDVPSPGGAVTIRVYDVAGRLVKELVNEFRPAGFHDVRWDGIGNRGEPIASGVYFVQMKSGPFAQARKLVLLK